MITQISVFMENRSGRLNNLLCMLAENNINICALSIAETSEFGIARLIVHETDKAIKVIDENGMKASEIEVIAVEFDDETGSLYHVTKLLADNNVNVEYAYSAIANDKGKALIILRVNDVETATKVISTVDFVNTLDTL